MAKSFLDEITTKDIVAAVGGIITLIAHYYMLKMEIHDLGTQVKSDITVINYRLNALEHPVSENAKRTFKYSEPVAILPSKIEIE